MKLLRLIYKDPWLLLSLGTVILQQLIVALGTYLLGSLASDVSHSIISYSKMALLLLCFVLSGSIIHFFVSILTVKAQKSILRKYFLKYFQINYNQPHLWRNVYQKSLRHDVMCREGQDAITQSTHYYVDALATVLNIIFNTISVMLVIDYSVGLCLSLAGVMGILIIHLFDDRIKDGSAVEMNTQNKLNGFINKCWDNLVLGNRVFYERWQTRWLNLFNAAESAALKRARSNEFATSLAGMVTTGMVVGFIFYKITQYQNQLALVTSLLVMLPRCMQIVMHLQIIQSYWTQWKQLKQKLIQTEQTILPVNEDAKPLTDSFIKYEQIKLFTEEKTLETHQLMKWIHTHPTGRLTISGVNGSGKSSLLVKLKEALGEKSIYIPSSHQLEINETEHEMERSYSSGETLLKTFSILKTCPSSDVYLLDEWDANLSKANRDLVNLFIQNTSQKKLIIEVRHHESYC